MEENLKKLIKDRGKWSQKHEKWKKGRKNKEKVMKILMFLIFVQEHLHVLN